MKIVFIMIISIFVVSCTVIEILPRPPIPVLPPAFNFSNDITFYHRTPSIHTAENLNHELNKLGAVMNYRVVDFDNIVPEDSDISLVIKAEIMKKPRFVSPGVFNVIGTFALMAGVMGGVTVADNDDIMYQRVGTSMGVAGCALFLSACINAAIPKKKLAVLEYSMDIYGSDGVLIKEFLAYDSIYVRSRTGGKEDNLYILNSCIDTSLVTSNGVKLLMNQFTQDKEVLKYINNQRTYLQSKYLTNQDRVNAWNENSVFINEKIKEVKYKIK